MALPSGSGPGLGAAVERVVTVARVEEERKRLRNFLFELAAAVPHQSPAGSPNGEGACAEAVDFVKVAIAIRVAAGFTGLQATKIAILL